MQSTPWFHLDTFALLLQYAGLPAPRPSIQEIRNRFTDVIAIRLRGELFQLMQAGPSRTGLLTALRQRRPLRFQIPRESLGQLNPELEPTARAIEALVHHHGDRVPPNSIGREHMLACGRTVLGELAPVVVSVASTLDEAHAAVDEQVRRREIASATLAADLGNLQLFQQYAKSCPAVVTTPGEGGWTPLHMAYLSDLSAPIFEWCLAQRDLVTAALSASEHAAARMPQEQLPQAEAIRRINEAMSAALDAATANPDRDDPRPSSPSAESVGTRAVSRIPVPPPVPIAEPGRGVGTTPARASGAPSTPAADIPMAHVTCAEGSGPDPGA